MIRIMALALALAAGCTKYSDPYRVENVTRVLMHEPSRYTLLTALPDGRIEQHTYGGYGLCYKPPDLYHDVPPDKPIWAELREANDGCTPCTYVASIHLHSVEEINGAGWNHGKFGNGQTTVVE